MKQHVFYVLFALAFTGCSGGMTANSPSTGGTSYPDFPGAGGGLKDMQSGRVDGVSSFALPSGDIAFQGGWQSSCLAAGGGEYYRVDIVVDQNRAYQFVTQFDQAGCADAAAMYQTITYYAFASEGTATEINNVPATGLHSIVQWVRMVPLTGAMETLFRNQCAAAASNTWTQGVSQEVTGTCFAPITPVNTESRTIFNVTNNILRIGITNNDGYDGSDSAHRFHLLPTNNTSPHYLTRQ